MPRLPEQPGPFPTVQAATQTCVHMQDVGCGNAATVGAHNWIPLGFDLRRSGPRTSRETYASLEEWCTAPPGGWERRPQTERDVDTAAMGLDGAKWHVQWYDAELLTGDEARPRDLICTLLSRQMLIGIRAADNLP